MDFALGLLNRASQSQKAAQEAEKRTAEANRLARQAADEARTSREKQRIRTEADKLINRNTRIRRRPIAKQKDSATTRARPDKPPVRRAPPPKAAVARQKVKPTGPPKALPGMEFVVRRNKKKEIRVPHTSDYSDLFGDEFAKGIDLKCVKDMKAESAKATKEARAILAERKALAEELMKKADASRLRCAEMERQGLKPRDKHEWRRKAADNDWVTVDAPTGSMQSLPHVASGRQGASPSYGADARAKASSRGVAKDGVPSKDDIAERSRALRERIFAATGAATSKPRAGGSPKRARGLEEDMPRKKLKRPETGRSSRDEDRRVYQAKSQTRPRAMARPRSRHDRGTRGYNSEEWSDAEGGDEDDSDDDSDLYGIEALEREEERSRKLGMMEDREEARKEKERKREKERRRRLHEG